MGTAAKRNAAGKYQMDMCSGPLLRQIIVFAIPLMFTGMLQLVFHFADLVVVGRFASHQALAAVGSTTSLTHLQIGIFFGLAIGTNVLVARYIGAKERTAISQVVHTAMAFGLAGGIFMGVFGYTFARIFLRMMDTPDDVLDMAAEYMRITFIGLPLLVLYNFGAAVLRAAGDTRRPFYFLIIGGLINVFLNLFFVIVCGMDVDGVAWATVISQGGSLWLILRVMQKMVGGCRFKLKKMKIHWLTLRDILWIGVPAGFQGACFSIANIMIQSSFNTFGSMAIAGNTMASQCEAFIFLANNSFAQAAISFVGQNLGGKQYKRVRQSVKYCLITGFVILMIFVALLYAFRVNALSIFNKNPEVIKWGLLRFSIVLPLLFIGGWMETFICALRGLGYSIAPTAIMIFGICVYRIIWIKTVFRAHPDCPEILLWSYPISWSIVALLAMLFYLYAIKKYPAKNMPRI